MQKMDNVSRGMEILNNNNNNNKTVKKKCIS